jgi:cell division septum initiation protein DivIVA
MSDIRTVEAYDPAQVSAWLALTDSERARLRQRLEELRAAQASLDPTDGANERMMQMMRAVQAEVAAVRERAESAARDILARAEATADEILKAAPDDDQPPTVDTPDADETPRAEHHSRDDTSNKAWTPAPAADHSSVAAPSVAPPASWIAVANLKADWR